MLQKTSKKERKIRRGIYILPNFITTGSLFCGFFSIVKSLNGEFLDAAWMILLAGLFDALDGRVARLTRTHSDFGVEYDSLCDLASFGLAPAILAYTWSLNDFNKFGWGAAFLFFACGALRLARYNVQLMDVEKKHFQGLPIPCAAYALTSYIIFHHHWEGAGDFTGYLLLGLTVALALLMVSNVRYRSFKSFGLKRRESFFVLVGMAVVLFLVASSPALMILICSLLYVSSGLVEEIIYRYRQNKLPPPWAESRLSEEPETLRVIDGDLS